jgi:hypothetical protein
VPVAIWAIDADEELDIEGGYLALEFGNVLVQPLRAEVDAVEVGLKDIRVLVAQINRL